MQNQSIKSWKNAFKKYLPINFATGCNIIMTSMDFKQKSSNCQLNKLNMALQLLSLNIKKAQYYQSFAQYWTKQPLWIHVCECEIVKNEKLLLFTCCVCLVTSKAGIHCMRIFHGPLASFRPEDQKWKMNFVAENIIWAFSCANFFIKPAQN